MKPEAHGGDLRGMATASGRDPASLLDFSVNVRPEGAPEGVWMKPEQFKAWLPQPTDTTKNPEL